MAWFDFGQCVWSETGRHDRCAESPYDIVRIIRETPLPDGWRIDGEWLVCGDRVAVKRYTYGTVITANNICSVVVGSDAPSQIADSMAAFDAASAAHIAGNAAKQAESVLAWEETHGIWHASRDGVDYHVQYNLRNMRWMTTIFNALTTEYMSDQQAAEYAKAACERHARSGK